jgi:hypothetical protein
MSTDVSMNIDVSPRTEMTRRRRHMGWRIVGAVFAVLTICAGVLTTVSWLARQTEIQDQTYLRPATQIEIQGDTGNVTLVPGGPGVAVHRHLTWSWSKPSISETWEGQTLRLNTRCPGVALGPGCGVDYTLRVPVNATVVAHTSTGDISVRGLRGSLTLSTSTGDVHVTDAPGALSARTNTGDIDASGLASPTVDAHTDTGDVQLRFTQPPSQVQASASTGDVSVTVPASDAYLVQTTTDTGNSTVAVTQDPTSRRSIVAHTDTGDVHISYG